VCSDVTFVTLLTLIKGACIFTFISVKPRTILNQSSGELFPFDITFFLLRRKLSSEICRWKLFFGIISISDSATLC